MYKKEKILQNRKRKDEENAHKLNHFSYHRGILWLISEYKLKPNYYRTSVIYLKKVIMPLSNILPILYHHFLLEVYVLKKIGKEPC